VGVGVWFTRFILGLVLWTVAGYCIVLFGWVAYTNLVHVRDFEGAASNAGRLLFRTARLACHRDPTRKLVASAQTLAVDGAHSKAFAGRCARAGPKAILNNNCYDFDGGRGVIV
jgi:hypothetical protein